MEIKTKFNINEKIFFLYESYDKSNASEGKLVIKNILSGKISGIEVLVGIKRGNNGIITTCKEPAITYYVGSIVLNKGENQIFSSKEELIKCLSEQEVMEISE